jgi:hypothetical protein
MPEGRLPYLRPTMTTRRSLSRTSSRQTHRPAGPGAEELHRVVSLLDALNGVEDPVALLLEVVESAADEHIERRGHRVSL